MNPPVDPFRWLRKGPSTPPPTPPDDVQIALGYHQRSKHHEQRFAASLGMLDWANQPDPFRRYEGAPVVALARPRDDGPRELDARADGAEDAGDAPNARYADASARDAPTWAALLTPGALAPRPLDAAAVGHFLGHALALSAWKRMEGARWSLRVNPSSGNLHPSEGWLLLPATDGICAAPALLHYAPDEHVLEERARFDPTAHATATRGLVPGDVLVLLSSIPWREAWKYGERAWRYCRHDAGHALAALRYAAALCGWRLRAVPDVPHAALAALLGLDRADASHAGEPEHPEMLCVLRTSGAPFDSEPGFDAAELLAMARGACWAGRPNALSGEHHPWDVMDVVEAACRVPVAERAATHAGANAHVAADARADIGARPGADARAGADAVPDAPRGSAACDAADARLSAAHVLRARRSAVAMDRTTRLSRAAFVRMLARTLPSLAPVPWDASPWPSAAHLLLFVHRVDDVPPGLYLLVRSPSDEAALRAAFRPEFTWEPVDGVPADVPLVRLHPGDLRRIAARVSCGQDIAADGAFSAGMLVSLQCTLEQHGASAYPALFRQTGLLGQVLYLEAEAAGLRATGIGCFFDDAVHAVLGVTDLAFQSLYHFTVGGAVDDSRLSTEPAYGVT